MEERALGVDEVVRVLLEVSPPKVPQWRGLVAWLLLSSTYSAVRHPQAEHLSLPQEWCSSTWRVCPHERVPVCTAQTCQLCGDTDLGPGCPVYSVHVCLSCHRLVDAGWPGGSGPKRELTRKNASLRGKADVAAKMDMMVSRLGPLHWGPLPLAVVASWVHAHAAAGGGAQRFLLADWL